MSTSNLRFQALLKVQLSHEYLGGPWSEISTKPLPDTAILCRDLGLRMLQSNGSLELYARFDSSRPDSLSALLGTLAKTTLAWEITPLSPLFAATTDLEITGATQRAILTSSLATGGRLSVGKTVSKKDVWNWQALSFDFVPSKPLPTGAVLDLANCSGSVLARIVVSNPHLVPVDVGPFGSGLYQLVHQKEVLTRWFADERGSVAANSGPNSMLVLGGDLLAAVFGELAKAAASFEPPLYNGTYPARNVTWRYHVFNAADAKTLQIAVMDETGAAQTSAKETSRAGEISVPTDSIELANRHSRRKAVPSKKKPFHPVDAPEYPNAASFESSATYKLVRRPPQRFALLNGDTTVFAPLPVATPWFASRGQDAGLSSEIFVYL